MIIKLKEQKVNNYYVMYAVYSLEEIFSKDDEFNLVSIIANNYPRVRRMSYDQWYWPNDMYDELVQFMTFMNLKYG